MKNPIVIIAVLLLSFCGPRAWGQQTKSRNYILSRSYKQSGAPSDDAGRVNIRVRYLDGLGRPVQDVSVRRNPAGTDYIEPVEYDAAGRLVKTYLPYTDTGSGAYHTGAPEDAEFWYLINFAGLASEDLELPYKETFYEPSPLGRIMGERAPGGKSNSTSVTYKANGAGEVKRYDYNALSTAIEDAGHYAAGRLEHVLYTDEEGHTVSEFTDRTVDRMVCRKVNTGTESLDTYYVYDDLGLLRAVLQPQYQLTATDDYAFRYDYNGYGHLIRKKVPGGGTTEYVYDRYHRLAMSRDANQAARGAWAFVKYDALNRPVATGEVPSGSTRETWETSVWTVTERYENRDNNTPAGYTLNRTSPTGAVENHLLTVTFYDDYDFQKLSGLDYADPSGYGPVNLTVKGQVTGGRSRVLRGDGLPGAWLTHTVYYDGEYRPVQTVRQLHGLGTNALERVSTKYKYDLAAVVAEATTEQVTTTGTYTHRKAYEYDRADRLLMVKETVTTPQQSKTAYTVALRYNASGQLREKWLHAYAGDPARYRVRTDYLHTIRGWVSEGATFYKPSEDMEEQPYYAFDLQYDKGGAYTNGNISRMRWKGKDAVTYSSGLSFSYDGANRLTGSTGLSGYTDTESGISYDKNGNIKTLARAGYAAENLGYTYNGNRLSSVNGANYTYDASGNMLTDGRRSAAIAYNHLNLPKAVTLAGKTFLYDYDASATKHRYYGDTVDIRYAGAFEYDENNELRRVATTEGQVVPSGDTLTFQYYLNDHLGNVRLVFDENGDILQQTDYYPFGLQIPRDSILQAQATRNGINRYLFNGIEKQPETGIYLARFRGLDPTIGRWMQIDPKPDLSISLYAAMNNNPIRNIDPLGDTIVVDKIGYVSRNDKSDNSVFMQDEKGQLTRLGELGKKIDVSQIYTNLLKTNTKTAVGIYNPFKFKNLVKSKGEWDYKANKKTIYGLGNDGKTQFLFKEKSMEAQDIGNHHFGAVANAYGFGLEFSLKQAGVAQIHSGTSRPEWQIYGSPEIIGWTPKGLTTIRPMLAPYGDDPRDQSFIKEGFQYYNQNKNN